MTNIIINVISLITTEYPVYRLKYPEHHFQSVSPNRPANLVDWVLYENVICLTDWFVSVSIYCRAICRHGGQFIGNRYGRGTGRIWLDRVRCRGTETDIGQCPHRGWGVHNCHHYEDVSVSCPFIAPSFIPCKIIPKTEDAVVQLYTTDSTSSNLPTSLMAVYHLTRIISINCSLYFCTKRKNTISTKIAL